MVESSITDYGMLAQVFLAFAAGLISFLSPCVLPLVPGYISIVSGSSLDQLKSQQDASVFRTVLLNSVMFVVGFSITFIFLGASASALGQLLQSNQRLFGQIAGLILIVFGIHLLGIVKINFLYRDKRFHSVQKPRGALGSLVIGLAFAFGWTPCIGPILAGIMAIASTQETVRGGMFLLAIYSAGLAVPFLLTSLALNKFLGFYSRFKKHFRAVEIFSGGLVITVGIMMITGSLTRIAGYFSFLNRYFAL